MIWQRSAWMFWQVLVMTVADGLGTCLSGMVLRVTRHEHVASLTVIMAGTVILWLVATAS